MTKSQNQFKNLSRMQLVLPMLMLAPIIALVLTAPAWAETFDGSTLLEFSVNPAALSGDGATDVTITTTTTAPGASQDLINDGRITIPFRQQRSLTG